MRSKAIPRALWALCLAGLAAGEAQAGDLAAFFVVGNGIPEYLSGQPGDPERGREIAIRRNKGNCLACHKMPIPDAQYHGEVAPDLAGVGSRMPEAELRLRIVNPKIVNPDTMMPSFYRISGLHRVAKQFRGKTILTPQEVEDVVAYLKTLRDDTD